MHQLNTLKSIIDCPECHGCMTSHRTGQAELVFGLDKLVEQLARVFNLLHPAFELQGSTAHRSTQQLESSKI